MTAKLPVIALALAAAVGLSAQQTPTGAAELDAIVDAIVTRAPAGDASARPDPAALLARLRAIDPTALSFDEQIDRRFAETILTGRLVRAPAGQPMGEAAYTRMLREQHLLPYDAAGLWTFARTQFDATVRELEALARTIDATKTWRQIVDEVKQDHPAPLEMIEAHQEIVDKARAHLVANDLMSLPWPETCTVVRRTPTAGNNPYYGSFSGATSRPPAADGTLRGEWHINPFDPAWDAATQRDYLVEHDWGVIYVTAPHETYGGHHVQIVYQMHNPRPLRRRQSTSMFSEGWGLYNEQLFQETGFLPNERLHLRQLQLRLWRNARVIYDVGLQTGRMRREEAITLMTDEVGFLRWAAESEVDAALARPGYFIGYFMGMSEILKMRDEFRTRMGAAFSLKDFHDRLLRIGSMPPALVRESLLHGLPPAPPSHFVFFGRDHERVSDPGFLALPRIDGAQLTYTWRELEPERDQYDFSAIRDHLALLARHGKRLFVQLSDVSFADRVNVPRYLQSDPAFHGGAVPKLEGAGGTFDGWVARRWDPAVRERFARLLNALGREFDGRIEGLNLPETAIGFEAPAFHPPGFSFDAYAEGIRANLTAAREAFSRSRVIIYANFMPGDDDRGYLRSIYELAARLGAGVGGPDLLPHRPGQQANSLPLIAARAPGVVAGMAVQDGNLSDIDPATGTPQTVDALYRYATTHLRLDYIFWGAEEPFLTRDVLPYLLKLSLVPSTAGL